ncbi:MAG: hypothetical protein U9R38_02870 [Candidatus Margulisiibacteriota bacterium]|nr:hypothetical protein [Candidatus Margulisiibacteriota bacterium]
MLIDLLTQRLRYKRQAGFLYVDHGRGFALSEAALTPPCIRLTVSESSNLSCLLASSQAKNILIARGYNTVFYISEVKPEGKVPSPNLEYVKIQVILQANTNIVSFILEKLRTPRLITWTENREFCDQILNWAKSNDPRGEIVMRRSDGVLLKEMDPASLSLLEHHFTDIKLTHLKKRQKPSATSFADTRLPSADTPWGETVMHKNIMRLFGAVSASAGSVRPTNLYLRVDLEDGLVEIVDHYQKADLIFAFSRWGADTAGLPDGLRKIVFARGINLSQAQISNLWATNAIFHDRPKLSFFVQTARKINDQLCGNHIQSELSRSGASTEIPDQGELLAALLNKNIEVGSL